MRGIAPRFRRLAAVAGLLAAWSQARADGLSLYLEPIFTLTREENQDQLGNSTEQTLRTLQQNYRLNFDRGLTPAFAISAGALFEGQRSWTNDPYGKAQTLDGSVKGLYARLNFSLPDLTAGISYDLAYSSRNTPGQLVSENLSLYSSWRPFELPELNVRLARTHQYDTALALQDLTTWSALVSARYVIDPFEVRYVLNWAQPTDSVTGTESSAIAQNLQGIYATRLFGGRSAIYVSLILRNQMLHTVNAGSGTVSTQQHPVGGLSFVEQFPAQPGTDTLLPNPALIDGNLQVSAAVDLGYAPSVAGDSNRRDLGVQFADVLTPVNSIEVWVDRTLPPEIAIDYSWAAYQSDDNKTWVQVAIAGPVSFGPFVNRFSIPISETRARYLKVVTEPLRVGVSVDPAYANVFVTEMQVFLVQQASSVPRDQATSGALLNVTASTLVWRAANLSWDLTALAERRISPSASTWNLMNALSASQWLARGLQLNERVSRQDFDEGLGHNGQTDWSAGFLWRPLPTFTGSLIYSGQFIDSRPTLDINTGQYVNLPVGFNHSLTSLMRADLYEGISALLNASWSLQNEYDGTNRWSGTLNGTLAISPNPWVSFTLGWLSGLNILQIPGLPNVDTTTARIDGTVTVRPTNALSALATVSRIVLGGTPTTFGTVQVNWSPLRGDLQLTVAYSKTFDTTSQSTIELFTPGVRWNLRPGIQITGSYTLLNTTAPVSKTHSRSLSLGLNLLL